ncbi:hypothetical protein ABTY98_05070 [Streptomyces sp. NPDC096040]|uniref:Acb2/Tad1 domain-containing protein n=1 Tax=Streptomyces sp. NPDC096040 TaxID=3155541 RepID=UPI0033316865
MAITRREIGIRFAPPRTDDRRNAIKAQISAKAEELAQLIHELVPGCREQSVAISAVEDAVDAAHNGVDRRLVLPGERRTVPTVAAPAGPPAAELLDGA